jgi:hypothetical protein
MIKNTPSNHLLQTLAQCTSWNGHFEHSQKEWRSSIMFSTTFGLLWVVWSFFYTCGGFILLRVYPKSRDTLHTFFFLLCCWGLSMKVPHQEIIMALGYWIAGISFLPIEKVGWFFHLMVIAQNYIVMSLFQTRLYPFLSVLLVLKKNVSLPTMYNLHPCSLFCSIPLFVCLSFFIGVTFSSFVPSFLGPFLIAPYSIFKDPFNEAHSTIGISVSTMGVCILALNKKSF